MLNVLKNSNNFENKLSKHEYVWWLVGDLALAVVVWRNKWPYLDKMAVIIKFMEWNQLSFSDNSKAFTGTTLCKN